MTREQFKYEHQEPKRLFRSRNDRMLAGVCGGLADYLDVDAVLIRIAWVVLTLFGGIGLLLYIAAVIIIPEDPEQKTTDVPEKGKSDKAVFLGALFVIIGAALLLRQFGFFYHINFWHLPWQLIWAVFLILIGVFLLYNKESARWLKRDAESDETDDSSEKKQVYRSRSNRMIAGVCGGLAEYFDLDPTIVRLGYVLLTLASVGIGFVAYVAMIIVFPEEPYNSGVQVSKKES